MVIQFIHSNFKDFFWTPFYNLTSASFLIKIAYVLINKKQNYSLISLDKQVDFKWIPFLITYTDLEAIH